MHNGRHAMKIKFDAAVSALLFEAESTAELYQLGDLRDQCRNSDLGIKYSQFNERQVHSLEIQLLQPE